MSADTPSVSRGTRPRRTKPDATHHPETLIASPLATAAPDRQLEPLRYRLKREDRHCWSICRLHHRKTRDTYEPFEWFPRLEQACDRLAELYLHENVAWEVVNLADVRKAISELKANLTDEMLNRMTIQ